MTYFISGDNGFVGQRLIDSLILAGEKFIRLSKSGKDITDKDYFKEIDPKEGDVLIHLANKSFVPESWQKLERYFDVNLMGTINALEFCKSNKLGIVYLSSYLYGDPMYFPIDEKHEIKTNNPYALSKKMCEEIIQFYGQNFDVLYTILRPFNIYGSKQKENYLIPTILNQVISSKELNITLMDTRPKRDFIHVQDVVDAILLSSKSLKNQIFNVCSGNSISIKDLCAMILEISGSSKQVIDLNQFRKNEIMDCYGSFDKIKNSLGWQPKVSLEAGLRECLE